MNANAVKNSTYRAFEVFFCYFIDLGKSRLGYQPPGGLSIQDKGVELGLEPNKGLVPAARF